MRKLLLILLGTLLLIGCTSQSEIDKLNEQIVELENTISIYENKIERLEEDLSSDNIDMIVMINHVLQSIKELEVYSDDRVTNYSNGNSKLSRILFKDLGELYDDIWNEVGSAGRFYEVYLKPFIEKNYKEIDIKIINVYETLGYYYNRESCVEMNLEGITKSDVKQAYKNYIEAYEDLVESISQLD